MKPENPFITLLFGIEKSTNNKKLSYNVIYYLKIKIKTKVIRFNINILSTLMENKKV